VYRYYTYSSLVRDIGENPASITIPKARLYDTSRYENALARGCEPMAKDFPTVRCPFWITP
jgi:hypothetical protein